MPLVSANKESYRWLAAELVVVVLGILIAFQVEEWRTSRGDREIEAGSLRVLLTDIETGRDEYENVKETSATLKESSATMLEFMLDPASQTKDVAAIPSIELRTWRWEPTSSAFDSLRDSGNLGLISNQELQSALLYYFDLIEPYFLGLRVSHSELVGDVDALLDDFVFVRPRPDYLVSGEVDRVMQVSMEEFVNDPELLETLIQLEGSATDRLIGLADSNIGSLNDLEKMILEHLGEI